MTNAQAERIFNGCKVRYQGRPCGVSKIRRSAVVPKGKAGYPHVDTHFFLFGPSALGWVSCRECDLIEPLSWLAPDEDE